MQSPLTPEALREAEHRAKHLESTPERIAEYVTALNPGWTHVVREIRGRLTLTITQEGRIR